MFQVIGHPESPIPFDNVVTQPCCKAGMSVMVGPQAANLVQKGPSASLLLSCTPLSRATEELHVAAGGVYF